MRMGQPLLLDIVNMAFLQRQNAGLTGWSRNQPRHSGASPEAEGPNLSFHQLTLERAFNQGLGIPHTVERRE